MGGEGLCCVVTMGLLWQARLSFPERLPLTKLWSNLSVTAMGTCRREGALSYQGERVCRGLEF